MAIKLETIYLETSLQDVFNFFADNYKLPMGSSIVTHDVFIDTHKQKVVFKLIVKKVEASTSADSTSAASSNPSPACRPQSSPES